MFRRPSLSLAEIIWRWSFGAAACVLFGIALIAYLDTLPVSNRDLRMLRTGHPALLWQALAHISRGSALRALLAGIILAAALALIWIVIASVGRAATLGPLLAYMRGRARPADNEISSPTRLPDFQRDNTASSGHLGALAGLHFLRVALGVAACAAGLGAIVLASTASTRTDPHPGLVFFLTTTMLLGIWALWSTMSWFLAAAPIFVIREGKDAFGALLEAATLFRKRTGPVIAVGSWFGITHLILLIAASSVVMFPLAFSSIVPPLIVFSAVLFLTLTYFAIVDALYIGRLAGYVAILEAPPQPPPLVPPPPMPSSSVEQQIVTHPELATVDQSETILSDVAPCDTNDLSSQPEATPPEPNSPKSEI